MLLLLLLLLSAGFNPRQNGQKGLAKFDANETLIQNVFRFSSIDLF
jgi:hypothetical protein